MFKFKMAFRVWHRNYTVYKKLFKSSIVMNFFEPILYLTALGFGLGAFIKEINGMPYINFIAPGLIASSTMFATSAECTYGTYIRMTYQKTFDAILATPVSINDLIAGELIWGATKSVFYGTIIMVVISVMGYVDSPLIILAIPVLIFSGIIFAEIAIIATAIVPGIDSFSYFISFLLTPSFLFSGIFFPLDTLPAFVEKIAFFIPLYHTVNILRAFSLGTVDSVILDMLWLVAVSGLLAPYSFRLMRKRIEK